MLSSRWKDMTEKRKRINIKGLPISLKTTLWYTTFLCILLGALVLFSFAITDNIATSISKIEMSKAVSEIASGKEEYNPFHDGIYIVAYAADGKLLEGKLPKSFQGEETFLKSEFREYSQGTSKYLYLDVRVTGGQYQGGWLRGIISLSGLTSKLKVFPIMLAIISPFILLLVAFVGYGITKKAFKPVRQISQTAIEIGKNYDLSKRIQLAEGDDEIRQMADAFNDMLNSLESFSIREKQFTSDVSHELRTPIAVILAESQYGFDCAQTLEDAQESFQVITRQSRRMSKIVSQLLEISRMDQLVSIEKQKFQLSAMLKSMISDYKNLCESNGLVLTDNITDNLYINGDMMMIQRVFDNLFSNALKFAKSQIHITLTARKDKYILVVEDDGPGISKEDQSKIWERFYQADKSRNRVLSDGVGLGLSMVKKIVLLHRGAVHIKSKLGEGSSFIVELDKADSKE